MIGQLRRFLGVGVLATLVHVAVAMAASGWLAAAPGAANLLGFAAAVGVSYLGHAFVTFGNPAGHAAQLPRFVALSLGGLAASAGITALVCDLWGGPFALAQALVALVVPATTFALSRAWAFAPGARA